MAVSVVSPRRRWLRGAALSAGLVGTWLVASAAADRETVGAAEHTLGAADGVEIADPAVALHPAQRVRLPNLLYFPMQPTPRCEILSNFGEYRSGGRRHEGVDMLSTLGQEVYAVADGVITDKEVDGQPGTSLSGNLLDLTTTTARYAYAHLSGFAPGIELGSEVVYGQLIGYVGDTGNPGPGNYHLHFEVHPLGGAAVDPLKVLKLPDGCTVF